MGLVGVALLSLTASALADRPVTNDERAKLEAALKAQGCTGGEMEYDEDDRQFEVDDAVCADGRKYGLKFDTNFQMIRKDPG
jgi:hypothetical protein